MPARTWISVAIVLLVTVLAAVVLWPAEDPLANVSTVAIQPPDWDRTDPSQALRAPFMDGLAVTLGRRHVRIVADPKAADALLVVKDIRVAKIEFRFESGELTGRVSAICVLTEARTGKGHVMDFTLELGNGTLRATLTPRKFWQFWKRG